VYDEPFADSSNVPTYLVSEFARRGVKVVLSGDGGDELFGGYSWYAPLLAGFDSREPPEPAETDWWERHVGSATHLFADRAALWGVGNQPAAGEAIRQGYKPGGDWRAMDRATHFDLACYLPGDILAKVDRAAMAHGLETRCPFLDVDLAEFVLGLPWQLRFKGGGASLKWLLREACGDLWPPSLRTRPKQGFGAPVRHWLQRPDVQALWQRVTRPGGPLVALLPGAADANILEPLRPQRRWTLLCLGLWLEGQGRSQCLRNL
jgi:asparagine synthase (glutamine-hydrolysing)